MAKAKSQSSSTTSIPEKTTPSSTGDPLNCTNDSNCERVKPDLGTAIDKADSSSSHNISISSINEDDNNDSSAFESSDSECDDEQIKKAVERIPNSLQPGEQLVQNGMLVVKDNNESPASARGPNIGSIAVQNSSDITFGNKTYIKGQVVIKNIYHDKQNGNVNPGYNETDGELGAKKSDPASADSSEPPSWRSSLKAIIKDKPLISVMVLIALMVVVTITAIMAYLATTTGKPRLKPHYSDGDDDRAYVPPDTGIDKDFLPDPKPLRMVTRNEWLARPPKDVLTPLKLPVHRVIIAHTATEGCNTQSSCVYRVRFIQEKHISTDNFGDIGYNFLIGGDGNVYEGRGWFKVGAFLRGQNTLSEGIAFIGDYRRLQPTETQMEVLDSLLQNGTRGNVLSSDFKLYGALQWQATLSPGELLYERIKKHPRWSEDLV